MKDITLLIRVSENQFTAEPELIKFLVWEALVNGKSIYWDEAFTVEQILVSNIDEAQPQKPPETVYGDEAKALLNERFK